eukprot:TRINITY_DN1681_c0_g1_i1.p1 TRINITY_DN1681_c0_g1~~TRINITY_DN1681_c0_g1_i1.p1  ORF type:complete len:498 (+),score=146.76 TRINITY_DN1681_c0_g1_i1:32-1495(+)
MNLLPIDFYSLTTSLLPKGKDIYKGAIVRFFYNKGDSYDWIDNDLIGLIYLTVDNLNCVYFEFFDYSTELYVFSFKLDYSFKLENLGNGFLCFTTNTFIGLLQFYDESEYQIFEKACIYQMKKIEPPKSESVFGRFGKWLSSSLSISTVESTQNIEHNTVTNDVKPKTSKPTISGPIGFDHEASVEYDPSKGYVTRNVPVEIMEMLVGVTEDMEIDDDTRAELLQDEDMLLEAMSIIQKFQNLESVDFSEHEEKKKVPVQIVPKDVKPSEKPMEEDLPVENNEKFKNNSTVRGDNVVLASPSHLVDSSNDNLIKRNVNNVSGIETDSDLSFSSTSSSNLNSEASNSLSVPSPPNNLPLTPSMMNFPAKFEPGPSMSPGIPPPPMNLPKPGTLSTSNNSTTSSTPKKMKFKKTEHIQNKELSLKEELELAKKKMKKARTIEQKPVEIKPSNSDQKDGLMMALSTMMIKRANALKQKKSIADSEDDEDW